MASSAEEKGGIISSTKAERVADDILAANEEILAISIIDARGGNVLASKPKESFTKEFGVFQEGPRYGGSLALSFLSIANEIREIAGETQSIITTYERCKGMLIPLPVYKVLVGLVLLKSVNAEDYDVSNKVERLFSKEEKEDEERRLG
jgi:hypothetical protein